MKTYFELREAFAAYAKNPWDQTEPPMPIYKNPSTKEIKDIMMAWRERGRPPDHCRGLVSSAGDIWVFPAIVLHDYAKKMISKVDRSVMDAAHVIVDFNLNGKITHVEPSGGDAKAWDHISAAARNHHI